MKVLFVTNYKPNCGGISVQVDTLKCHLEGEGFEVRVFSTKGSWLRRLFLWIPLFREMAAYDVIHAHGCSSWGFLPIVYAVILGRMRGRRVIVSYHGGGAGSFFARRRCWVRSVLMQADERTVMSGYLAEIFDQYKIPCRVISNVLDFNGEYRQRSTIMPRYISVRSLEPLYRIQFVIEAFEEVVKQIPDASLTLLGGGTLRQELEQYVHARKIPNVYFVGQVSNEEIPVYLNEADVMVSAPEIDNMPISLLEAFHAGVLVISSNVGGIPYMVEHGKTGYLFKREDKAKLVEYMLLAVWRPEISLQMIENARKQLTDYAWDSVREKLLPLYKTKKKR